MPLLESITRALKNEIRIYANRKETRLTIQELLDFGRDNSDETILRGAQFLQTEFPIRLAKRVLDIEELPLGLADMPSVRVVQGWYLQSLRDLLELPHPTPKEAEARFSAVIERIKNRHNTVVPTMARGIQELKRHLGREDLGQEIAEFLDRFYMSRIGIRMLIGQHIALHRSTEGWVGILCEQCSPVAVAQEAIPAVQALCRQNYGAAPEVEIDGKVELTFSYIPSHLHHMLFELLKNSMRATAEFRGKNGKPLRPIRLIVAGGEEDITLKICDRGGGIPRSAMPRLFSYSFTTAPPPPPESVYTSELDPMAGLGYGLPISRLYARYFGGDLQLISMEGYGTDA